MKFLTDYEKKYRYGFFVHYVAGKAVYKDGSSPADIQEAADRFDVPGFVRDIVDMRVDYLIFTAWHFRMIPLYPSAVTEAIRPGCSCRRDLIGEIVDGLKKAGVGVILYTHPRDGHDFVGAERTDCGWGEGCLRDGEREYKDEPNPDTFDYQKWNTYVQALYKELIDRYGDRIDGIYTDSNGPCYRKSDWPDYERPIVDYLGIRRTVKADPRRVLVQNGIGCEFTDDFVMPEGYFGFERVLPVRQWPACRKALAASPFFNGQWGVSGQYGKDWRRLSPEDAALFTVFQSTCTEGGGMCWASSPYCGGGWDVGVTETMREIGRHMSRLAGCIRDTVPSRSWPTVSGDTLESKNGVFAASSADRAREYIHVASFPAHGTVTLPAPEDHVRLINPRVMTGDMVVRSFEQDESGVRITLDGTPDEIDTVISFERINDPLAPAWTWINCTDKRLRYLPVENWRYHTLSGWGGDDDRQTLGAYEYDARESLAASARMDTWIEGSEVEIYGSVGPEGGEADLVIDDLPVLTLSCRAGAPNNRVLLGSSGELFGGVHTVTLVSRGKGFAFEAMRVRR